MARRAGKIVIGDVRDVADGVALGHRTNQKVSGWSHGRLRQYITYKAEHVGIEVVLQDEHYTTQTCPVWAKEKAQRTHLPMRGLRWRVPPGRRRRSQYLVCAPVWRTWSYRSTIANVSQAVCKNAA